MAHKRTGARTGAGKANCTGTTTKLLAAFSASKKRPIRLPLLKARSSGAQRQGCPATQQELAYEPKTSPEHYHPPALKLEGGSVLGRFLAHKRTGTATWNPGTAPAVMAAKQASQPAKKAFESKTSPCPTTLWYLNRKAVGQGEVFGSQAYRGALEARGAGCAGSTGARHGSNNKKPEKPTSGRRPAGSREKA